MALAGSNPAAFAAYMIVGVGVPIIVSFIGYRFMRKMGWAKPEQLHLEMI
ncbi:Predicted nicotinate-regulated transporter BH3254 [Leuconostoc inhae]|nr:Predicted nicotinate-regulated transporter BH3254 [Leuconostoc inhae]